MALKPRINIVLPIALSIILPGLGLYANNGVNIPSSLGILGSWLLTSLILYFLWHILWFGQDLKSQKRKLWFGASVVLFVGTLTLVYCLTFSGNEEPLHWSTLLRIILGAILFLAIQSALKAQQSISQLHLEKEKAQTENYKAQLKALRAQVDPHFLFNSLNTLRSMVRQQHMGSEQFIMSLSDFYRQTLKHNDNTILSLSEELSVMKSYLFLMKSRNEESVSLRINIDKSLYQYRLPSLALQVAVENCFKHNSMTSKNPLHIDICSTEDFYIEVKNNVQPKIGDLGTSGFGLDLLRRRYELLNVQSGVIVNQTPHQFSVKLKLI